jgi:hypothetical protein
VGTPRKGGGDCIHATHPPCFLVVVCPQSNSQMVSAGLYGLQVGYCPVSSARTLRQQVFGLSPAGFVGKSSSWVMLGLWWVLSAPASTRTCYCWCMLAFEPCGTLMLSLLVHCSVWLGVWGLSSWACMTGWHRIAQMVCCGQVDGGCETLSRRYDAFTCTTALLHGCWLLSCEILAPALHRGGMFCRGAEEAPCSAPAGH